MYITPFVSIIFHEGTIRAWLLELCCSRNTLIRQLEIVFWFFVWLNLSLGDLVFHAFYLLKDSMRAHAWIYFRFKFNIFCRPNANRGFTSMNDGNITICDNVALNKCADEVGFVLCFEL